MNKLRRKYNKGLKSFYALKSQYDSKAEISVMKHFKHHGHVTCYDHSWRVTKYSYLTAYMFNLDLEATFKGALFHDYYLYNRFEKVHLHGYHHGKVSLRNAEMLEEFNDKEKNIVLSHMFPLTDTIPKYSESWVVTVVDKLVSTGEYLKMDHPNR